MFWPVAGYALSLAGPAESAESMMSHRR